MKILSFYLKGKMAHFRRFYSNSSSLSYSIPPRTTICGIIAGLLGYERDTYYEEFSLCNCKIAVAIKAPLKKLVHTVNLLKVENINELNGSSGFHTQTATELIMPYDIKKQDISYQVWFYHADDKFMNILKDRLSEYQPAYCSTGISMALGTAYNLGWIEFVGEMDGIEENGINTISLTSVVPQKQIDKIEIGEMFDKNYRLIKEEIPLEFAAERKVNTNSLGNMIFDLNGNEVPLSIDKYIKLSNGENITWME